MGEKQIDNQLDDAVKKAEKEKIEAEEKEINNRRLLASEIAKELKSVFEKKDYSEIIEAINAIEVNPIVSVKSPAIELKERKIEIPKIKIPKAERPIINLKPEITVKASDVKFPAFFSINGFLAFSKTIIDALKNKIRVTASKEDPLPVALVHDKKFYEALGGGGGGPSKVWLKNTDGAAISPATEDKQDDIISGLGDVASFSDEDSVDKKALVDKNRRIDMPIIQQIPFTLQRSNTSGSLSGAYCPYHMVRMPDGAYYGGPNSSNKTYVVKIIRQAISKITISGDMADIDTSRYHATDGEKIYGLEVSYACRFYRFTTAGVTEVLYTPGSAIAWKGLVYDSVNDCFYALDNTNNKIVKFSGANYSTISDFKTGFDECDGGLFIDKNSEYLFVKAKLTGENAKFHKIKISDATVAESYNVMTKFGDSLTCWYDKENDVWYSYITYYTNTTTYGIAMAKLGKWSKIIAQDTYFNGIRDWHIYDDGQFVSTKTDNAYDFWVSAFKTPVDITNQTFKPLEIIKKISNYPPTRGFTRHWNNEVVAAGATKTQPNTVMARRTVTFKSDIDNMFLLQIQSYYNPPGFGTERIITVKAGVPRSIEFPGENCASSYVSRRIMVVEAATISVSEAYETY